MRAGSTLNSSPKTSFTSAPGRSSASKKCSTWRPARSCNRCLRHGPMRTFAQSSKVQFFRSHEEPHLHLNVARSRAGGVPWQGTTLEPVHTSCGDDRCHLHESAV